ERAGNDFILDQFPELIERSGRSKRADAQRVKEVSNESDRCLKRRRRERLRALFRPDRSYPCDQIEEPESRKCNEKPGFDSQHSAYAIRAVYKGKSNRTVDESFRIIDIILRTVRFVMTTLPWVRTHPCVQKCAED